MLEILLEYGGAFTLALLFLYGLRNYTITLIAGFIAFCVFYFSFGVNDFEWTPSSILPAIKNGAIIYYISCAIAIVVYKINPLHQKKEVAAK